VTPNLRKLLWAVALAGTLAAVVSVGGNDADSVEPVAREPRSVEERPAEERPATRTSKATKDMPVLKVGELKTRGLGEMSTDLFSIKSWYVPPPPPPPMPPPKPVAPPLPFTFIGRMIEEGQTAVFVSIQDRNQVLHVGDVVQGVWRVDAIDPTNMKLTYLPLNENKYLALGAAP
jgi:hypothetical protein